MLNRTHRFHGLNSLNFAHQQGKVVRGSVINLKYVVNQRRSDYRVAVVVSKKVSKSAVVRNRIRRRVYEAIRLHAEIITKPYDLVFMVYSADVATMDSSELQDAIANQLRKAVVL